MPQMSALMWDILFMMFSAFLLLSMIKMYYISLRNVNVPTQEKKYKKTSTMAWMW